MIPNWLMQRAYLTPHKTAFSFGEEHWTFLEMKDRALQLAGKLKGQGLASDSRIALLGSSNPEMVFMIQACLLADLEIVMLNSRLTAEELKWQVKDSEAATVLVQDSLRHLVHSDLPILLFSEVEAGQSLEHTPQELWGPDRTITIMYTSGTTGLPKGVRQTAGNHTSSALSSVLNLGLEEKDVWLCAMPLFHISGFSILVRSLLYGMEVRLYEKFEAVAAAEEIRQGTVTRMSVVATMLNRILQELEKQNEVAHPSFRTMLPGGGPVPVNYLERAAERNMPVLQTYGMTETSSQTATLAAQDAIRKIGSAGKPLFFNQIKINGAQAAGDVGEVLIRGPHVTPGYIGHAATEDPLRDGWLPTGDLGYIDAEGYLFIVDRRSDLIISGGENIYPAEIENVLASHPAVLEAGVCGQADPEWGSVPVAFVVKQGEVTEDTLTAFCEERLARYKLPKAYYFVDQLPRNASNKLLRRELKQWAAQQEGRGNSGRSD
ncbi:2-succinylbenzoate-CoA ligase [Bacillus sp. OxB-1]|uniref:o-succinylbenzoate--CoA ligase n=1 Tax=Bacillus sp. (strain OxB-1) TaxID=98228 RepID=UPI000581C880|nr:o-succinylbenzoate--CoA ligase [Bacillus sp. OxB-1]BAQ08481.1 2-succinylbenzoate-CoA ligase [Bacillus sp. OxB-1]